MLLSLGLAACSGPPPAADPVRSVRTEVLQPANAGAVLAFAGEVRARSEARLSFRVAGQLLSREVGLGDRVRAGQVLARLDPKDLQLAQQAAESAALAARTQFEQAAADRQRFAELLQQGFISAAEYERRDSAAKAAEATWRQALAQAQGQARQAGHAALVADAPGVVTAVEADPGTVLSAGAGVVRVAVDGPRDVVFTVPEAAIAWVQALHRRPGALGVSQPGDSQSQPAAIREIAAAADPVTRTFLVRAEVAGDPGPLGRLLTVRLRPPPGPAGLTVPLTAVFEHQGAPAVWVLDPSALTVRIQPIGLAGAESWPASGAAPRVSVVSGLTSGQEVVTAGVHVLTPGQKVLRYAEPRAGAAPAVTTAAPASPAASAAPAAAVPVRP